jgi:hypothetical protein
MSKKRIRVIHYGLGPIGLETARLVLNKSTLEIVGAVDISQNMIGKDLGTILGIEKNTGITVHENLDKLLSGIKADIVIHTAGSRIRTIYSQLEEIIQAGLNVVSSSEELLFPSEENKALTEELDNKAKDQGVTVLGTGINPGFIMDAFPLYLTSVCQDVKTIKVERMVDAGTRRYPLQKKVGAGLTPEQFRTMVSEKMLGHVGLVESLQFIAHYLGLSFDNVEETIDPVIAEYPVKTAYFDLKKGDVLGIKHIVNGMKNNETIVNLDLRMYVGADDPHDAIYINGIPNISLRIDGGVAGDQATAAILVNSIHDVIAAQPGLVTVKDLPAPHFCR